MTIDFSSDIYMHADLTALKEHLAARLDLISQYPEKRPHELERLIAQRLDIDPQSVMLTNGSVEAVHLIAGLYRGKASIIPQPTSTEYARACRIHRHIISYENTDTLTTLPKDRVYWICNPNNPSGNVLKKGFVDYLVRRSPRYTFVVDQSYEAYTNEPLLHPREMQGVPNLLMIHSIDKTYGVPGLRLGYITAHPNIIQQLRQRHRRWAFSCLSLEAGKFLVENGRPAITDIEHFLEESERLRARLREIEGLRVYETKTSFMLCQLHEFNVTDLAHYLRQEHQMLIYSCDDYMGLSDYFFRIAAQQPAENDALVEAIAGFLEKEK